MRLTVTGIGHLGLVHAACMAEIGHDVLGMDFNEDRVGMAMAAEPWFSEPGLARLLKANITEGRLKFTSSVQDVADFAQVHFICVPTPVKGADVDLFPLKSSVRALASKLQGSHLIVGKSTVPPGTAQMLQLACADAGCDLAQVCWNPEFLAEGTAIEDTLYPSRIVVGGTKMAEEILREVYAKLIGDLNIPFYATDLVTAELCKLASNAFLGMKVSFFNGMAQLASHWGGDADRLAMITGRDDRIGTWGTEIGLGFGGGCLPKDMQMLKRSAEISGLSALPNLLRSAADINRTRRNQAVQAAWQVLGDLKDKNIAVLGLAFKAGTSDTRDSPGLEITDKLRVAGAHVVTHDPQAELSDINQVELDVALRDRDLVIVCTDWDEYLEINPGEMPPGRIIDARYCLNRKKWEDGGWEFRVLDN